jgi:predicted acyl esterase
LDECKPLPYGVHHGTVDADEATWPYLAGHGIACVRVDSRGSGNSAGELDDEVGLPQIASITFGV